MENKYQEALDRIKNKVAIIDDEKMTIGQAYFRTFPILQELVDKETPMKTIHKCGEYEYHLCGKCKSTVNFWDVDSYCSKCGQKIEFSIEWSDEDEK